jgi:ribonuclease HI
VVDYTFYSKHRNRIRSNRIFLFLDQLVSGDKSRLLTWKDICNKAYIPMNNNSKKEEKWFKDIKKVITLDGVNLKQEVKNLFTCRFDNIEDTCSYDILKKDKSLVAIYSFQYNSILLGKVHKIDGDNVIIKHYNVDTSRNIDGKIFLSQCDNTFCSTNNLTQHSSICTFSTNWRYIVPIITASKFTKENVKKNGFVNYNIYNLFDVAKRKYESLQNTLTSSHVTSLNQSENIILELLEPSNSRNNLLIIQRTLSSFNNNTQCIFEFYTDGSLINLGTEQCSVNCSFAHLNTEFDIPQVEFATKIDNWPSAYRGELLAVILALCVVPKNNKVRINTDSLNVLTQFENLKKVHFHQTSREYFKNNNNHLWNILCRIILQLNLHVELFKIVAHGDDMDNDYVDHLAKEVHFNEDAYINFKNDASLMKILPKWNSILIEID